MWAAGAETCPPFLGALTGGAWLSSARVVRCWVKSRNERNPCPVLPARRGGDSRETAGVNSEEGGDDVKLSCFLCPAHDPGAVEVLKPDQVLVLIARCVNTWYRSFHVLVDFDTATIQFKLNIANTFKIWNTTD